MNPQLKQKDLPEVVEDKLRRWKRIFLAYSAWNSISAVVAIVSSGVAAWKGFSDTVTPAIFSGVAAISTSLVAFFKFKDKSSGYKSAWRVLHLHVLDYDLEPTEENLRAMYAAIKKGEEIIAGVDT